MNLEEMDEKELRKLKEQIKSREDAIKQDKIDNLIRKEKEKLDKLIKFNVIEILEHSRTSCSDDNPYNGYYETDGYAKCNKCHLIEIVEDHKNGINEFEVSLEITISKIGQ